MSEPKKDTQGRKWQITINNPAEHEMGHERIKEILSKIKGNLYWCMCDEIGLETQTYHTHLFIFRSSPFKFSQIKEMFPMAHIERVGKGTPQQNRDYIRKEGKWADSPKEDTNLKDTFEESGECPEEKQGERTDLENLYAFIKDGMSDYEILEQCPQYMKRLTDIERTRQIIRAEEFRSKLRKVEVEYWYGQSGTGKTFGIFNKWGFEKVYRITDYNHPWDGYRGQPVVVFEEFHSQVPISDMLNWLDVYPLDLPCRYSNKVACYEHVYITSNAKLTEQYRHIQMDNPETWMAFLRRISCQKYFDGKTIKEYTNIAGAPDKDGYIKVPEEFIPQLPFTE